MMKRRSCAILAVSSFLLGLSNLATAQSTIDPSCFNLFHRRIFAGPFDTVTVTITDLRQWSDPRNWGDSVFDVNHPDFYGAVRIDGTRQESAAVPGPVCGFPCGVIQPLPGQPFRHLKPNWKFSRGVPLEPGQAGPIPIRIELFDADSGADDQADLNPAGRKEINLLFDPHTGRWSGTVNWPQRCSRGTGSMQAEVCFDITSLPDSDGDGLLDFWELCGFDLDGRDPIDLDFPSIRMDPRYKDMADPRHKDLFLEIDWTPGQEPRQSVIQAMKTAFALAPVDAGTMASALTQGTEKPNTCGDEEDNDLDGLIDAQDPDCPGTQVEPEPATCRDGVDNDGDRFTDAADTSCSIGRDAKPNPDGKAGIRLWVDTGAQTDSRGTEGSVGTGSCRDRIDNDQDGFIDSGDADCARPNGREKVQPGSCNDRIDNDNDRLLDLADPDCLVGDDLGGGNSITASSALQVCNQENFRLLANLKADTSNFNPARRFIFRYALQAPGGSDVSRGELGGDDFRICGARDLPGVSMHEFGHTLNLGHGGNETANCKPNYVSVMNYAYALGIPQARKRTLQLFGEGAFFPDIFDFSPPRFSVEGDGALRSCEDGIDNPPVNGLTDAEDPDCLRRSVVHAPGLALQKDQLAESRLMDVPSPVNVNQFVFTDARGRRITWPLNGDRDGDGRFDGVDWNGNGFPPLVEDRCGLFSDRNGFPISLIPGTCVDRRDNGNDLGTCAAAGGPGGDGAVDFEDPGTPEMPECAYDAALPPINIDHSPSILDCQNTITNNRLAGFHDWLHISLPFRQFANSRPGVFDPIPDEPTVEELLEDKRDQNATDLAIVKTVNREKIRIGQDFRYNVTVVNFGPNPASGVLVVDVLPEGVTHLGNTGGCMELPEGGVLSCDLGGMFPAERREFSITVSTENIVPTREPVTITNTATVENVHETAGADPSPEDNTAMLTTTLLEPGPEPEPEKLIVDVRPWSCDNTISSEGAAFPIGIFGSEHLDVRRIRSIRVEKSLTPLSTEVMFINSAGACGMPDGHEDLLLQMDTASYVQRLGPLAGKKVAVDVEVMLDDGTVVRGSDTAVFVP